ncbi:hypothetical protein [Helicoverpa assulta nucleopolyhedrovirus]|nr:hypothetical protein [Helicoverpa assulta nucleopolyhedrovirus]
MVPQFIHIKVQIFLINKILFKKTLLHSFFIGHFSIDVGNNFIGRWYRRIEDFCDRFYGVLKRFQHGTLTVDLINQHRHIGQITFDVGNGSAEFIKLSFNGGNILPYDQ